MLEVQKIKQSELSALEKFFANQTPFDVKQKTKLRNNNSLYIFLEFQLLIYTDIQGFKQPVEGVLDALKGNLY